MSKNQNYTYWEWCGHSTPTESSCISMWYCPPCRPFIFQIEKAKIDKQAAEWSEDIRVRNQHGYLDLDYGKMSEHEKQAANNIAAQCIGRHFSKSVGEYLIHRIQMSTEI